MPKPIVVLVATIGIILSAVLFTACVSDDITVLQTTYQRFEAPADWTLISENTIEEPLCTGAACTTLAARWMTGEPPTGDDLASALESSGFSEVRMAETCEIPSGTGPSVPLAWPRLS